MKNMLISLNQHFSELALNHCEQSSSNVFLSYNDFQTLKTYNGECPLVFSYQEFYQSHQGWKHLMDGYLFLAPFLYSGVMKDKTILPPIARKILPSDVKGFYYSAYKFLDIEHIPQDEVYVFFDYFENLTHSSTALYGMDRIESLSRDYKKVNVILNLFLNSGAVDEKLGRLFESIRNLPANCSFISPAEFQKIPNLEGRKVEFIHDSDVLTHSSWEEISIIKNGFVDQSKISPADSFVHEFQVYPRVKKEIYFHKVDSPALSQEREMELRKLLKMIRLQDRLNPDYRRLLHDTLEL